MRIINNSPNDLGLVEKQQIYSFLKKYIPEGTVALPETVYDSACNWTILYSNDNAILGFSAQRFFDLGYFSLIQIMATFISKTMRGKGFAAILMQGQPFWNCYIKNPKKPIYWCTRTRIPSAFAASLKYNNIFPKISNENENIDRSDFSEFIARKVYGDHIQFDKKTYKITNSYIPNSVFTHTCSLKTKKYSAITNYFINTINYRSNEAIFIISKVSRISIIKYAFMKLICKLPLIKGKIKC